MNIKTLTSAVLAIGPAASILLRGDHGLGKSSFVFQVGRLLSEQRGHAVDVIDRRLSQMTEGDLLGLPSVAGGVTRFNPPDWLQKACDTGCVLFLDELNRATSEVMQAAFQLVLDRELCGLRLHPETVVFCAINTSGRYSVNDMDPALLDRFWTAEFTPSKEDWVTWAKNPDENKYRGGPIAETVIDFINKNEKWLDPNRDTTPSTVGPSRRSWGRLGVLLERLSLGEEIEDPRFHALTLGFVGTEATAAFYDFVRTRDKQLQPEEVLDKWNNKIKDRVENAPSEFLTVFMEKIVDHVKKNGEVSKKQMENLTKMADVLPGEIVVKFWTCIASSQDKDKHGELWVKRLLPCIQAQLVKYSAAKSEEQQKAGT